MLEKLKRLFRKTISITKLEVEEVKWDTTGEDIPEKLTLNLKVELPLGDLIKYTKENRIMNERMLHNQTLLVDKMLEYDTILNHVTKELEYLRKKV